MNNFNWRPMASAPRDGSEFVVLTVVTHVGGLHRPIDIEPVLRLVHRATLCPQLTPDNGYWATRNYSLGDDYVRGGWWTTIDEYRRAIPLQEWRQAPTHNLMGGTGPLIFVRPGDHRLQGILEAPVLEAEVVWYNGDPHGWAGVKRSGYDTSGMSTGFLDGLNVCQWPFRWCLMSDFLPQDVFDIMLEAAEREVQWKRSNIERWRSMEYSALKDVP